MSMTNLSVVDDERFYFSLILFCLLCQLALFLLWEMKRKSQLKYSVTLLLLTLYRLQCEHAQGRVLPVSGMGVMILQVPHIMLC